MALEALTRYLERVAGRAGWKDIGAAAASGPVTLHLLAAQEVGKQILSEMQRTPGPTINGNVVMDGANGERPSSILDAPPPLE